MQKPRISIIAAIGKNRELGRHNALIWRISDDLKRFKALTTGHPIIMGRKTYESIGRPLPNRTNIVISQSMAPQEGIITASSLTDALTIAVDIDPEEVFVIGGAQVYREALSHAQRLYLTLIDESDADADAFFPDYSEFAAVVSEEKHSDSIPPYTWITLERP